MIMKKELEALLIKKYPTLYQPRKYPLERIATPFRFKCGDGWYALIDTLSELLVERFPGAISEGVLRDDEGTFLLLLSRYDIESYEYIYNQVDMATMLSEIICEKCAKKGTIQYFGGELTPICDEHTIQHKDTNSSGDGFDYTAPLFNIEGMGTMWYAMITLLFRKINKRSNYLKDPMVTFKRIDKKGGQLHIEFTGGDEVTHGQVELLVTYANKIDEETGEVLD